MKVSVVASGSNGNCCYVEHNGTSLLVDAGKSGRVIEDRLSQMGHFAENLDGILLTHSHSDHTQGAGVLSRRYGIPVFLTNDVFSESRHKLGSFVRKPVIGKFKVGSLNVLPVPTSHNVSSYGFKINDFGLFTDTGTVTREMLAVFPKLKAVLLESNHDIDMVINSRYPAFLKNWILSDKGHLSNISACELIQSHGVNLQLGLLGHLSGNNNTVSLAKKTFESLVKKKLFFHVCSRDKLSGSWVV